MPPLIDGFQFARSGLQIQGTLIAEQLPRLAQMTDCRVCTVQFTVAGGTGTRGKPALFLHALAQLELVCQRCLEPLAAPLAIDTELELSASELEIAHAEDEVDRVLATPAMNVAELVEDELILALPDTPKHESCAMASGAATRTHGSAFEALGRLKPGG